VHLIRIPSLLMVMISAGASMFSSDCGGDHLLRFYVFSDTLATAAIGSTSHNGVNYSTTGNNITGLLSVGSNGVNHGWWLIGVSPLSV
jgi:hypothetical protein